MSTFRNLVDAYRNMAHLNGVPEKELFGKSMEEVEELNEATRQATRVSYKHKYDKNKNLIYDVYVGNKIHTKNITSKKQMLTMVKKLQAAENKKWQNQFEEIDEAVKIKKSLIDKVRKLITDEASLQAGNNIAAKYENPSLLLDNVYKTLKVEFDRLAREL